MAHKLFGLAVPAQAFAVNRNAALRRFDVDSVEKFVNLFFCVGLHQAGASKRVDLAVVVGRLKADVLRQDFSAVLEFFQPLALNLRIYLAVLYPLKNRVVQHQLGNRSFRLVNVVVIDAARSERKGEKNRCQKGAAFHFFNFYTIYYRREFAISPTPLE